MDKLTTKACESRYQWTGEDEDRFRAYMNKRRTQTTWKKAAAQTIGIVLVLMQIVVIATMALVFGAIGGFFIWELLKTPYVFMAAIGVVLVYVALTIARAALDR